jgi:hypothetical protein
MNCNRRASGSVSVGEMLTHVTDLIKGSWRYATGLRGFLAVTIDFEQAKAILSAQLQNRDETFLRVLELGIYSNPNSPYLRLLQHVGIQFEDVRTMVREVGLESALSRLHDAGVYVTLDEFKGRTPVRRHGLEFPVSARDFDNPLLTAHYEGSTGGSRGDATRVHIDLDFLAYEAANFLFMVHAAGMEDRPVFVWRSVPPGMGLRPIFQFARFGHMATKWFSPTSPRWNRQGLQARALLAYTRLASRLFGRPTPGPQFLTDAAGIVPHLEKAVQEGRPALVVAGQSQWVQACVAAERAGANIKGTAFFGGGEPYTKGKAAVLDRVGATGITCYAMHESGTVAWACGAPSTVDEMHLLTDKLVVLGRPKRLDSGLVVQALNHTSLLSAAPKLMLNVESGDYGVLEERDCGCPWQTLGYTTHLHHVRSYEKLTSEGVMFMGSMVSQLLEEVLPARFGGSPLDYQLMEEEETGQTRVNIIVSPRVGFVDDAEVIEAVLKNIGSKDWSRQMADQWRKADTLRVRRREPYATAAGKILPLHVLGTTTPAPSNSR